MEQGLREGRGTVLPGTVEANVPAPSSLGAWRTWRSRRVRGGPGRGHLPGRPSPTLLPVSPAARVHRHPPHSSGRWQHVVLAVPRPPAALEALHRRETEAESSQATCPGSAHPEPHLGRGSRGRALRAGSSHPAGDTEDSGAVTLWALLGTKAGPA